MKLKQLIVIVFVFCTASVFSHAAQVDYLLKLNWQETVNDQPQDREIDIPILSFDWGIQNPLSIGSQGSGAGAGKVQFSSLLITKSIDSTSSQLFKLCATGAPINTATLTVIRKGGKSGDTVVTLSFNLLGIKSFQLAGTAGQDGMPVESVELAYAAVQPVM